MNIIGIAGGDRYGKTTLVSRIISSYPIGVVSHLPLDAYYRDHAFLSESEKLLYNFDHPDAIDFELLISDIKKLKYNISINRPVYSFITCSRLSQTINVSSAEVILVDGLFTLLNEELRKELTYKVFIDVTKTKRLERIIKRDINERGRNRRIVKDRFTNTVSPMHDKFVEPTRQFADEIINGNSGDMELNLNHICNIINSLVHHGS